MKRSDLYARYAKDCAVFIKDCRQDAGLSQLELAKRLGVFPSAISRAESGTGCLTVDYLARIADACDLVLHLNYRRRPKPL